MAGRPKKEKDPEGKSKFQLALEALNKKYGVGTVLTLDEKSNGEYEVISSGSIGVDNIALGIGGFVKGKLYEIMAWEGAGKTTLCAHVVAECQKGGGKAVYIDGEHAVDKSYFSAIGVDVSTMLLSQPSSGEEGFNIAFDLIETGEIDLVVIDSDSSLIPLSVIEGDIGESAIGKKARLNGSAYPKLKSSLSKNKTCVIVISQLREKIGVMFGDPRTTQGGHALKYYADCRIEMSRSLKKEDGINTANSTKLKTIKNKMSPPFRSCEFDILYGKGIDKQNEFINLLHDYEVAKIYGKSIIIGDEKFLIKDFHDLVENNPEYKDHLLEKLMEKIKGTPIEIDEEIEVEIHNQNKIEENEGTD